MPTAKKKRPKTRPGRVVKLKLHHDREWDEWQVLWIQGGKVNEKRTYYTGDRSDAVATLAAMRTEALNKGYQVTTPFKAKKKPCPTRRKTTKRNPPMSTKKLDARVDKVFYKHFDRKPVPMMDLPKISDEIRELILAGGDIDAQMPAIVEKYWQKNPSRRKPRKSAPKRKARKKSEKPGQRKAGRRSVRYKTNPFILSINPGGKKKTARRKPRAIQVKANPGKRVMIKDLPASIRNSAEMKKVMEAYKKFHGRYPTSGFFAELPALGKKDDTTVLWAMGHAPDRTYTAPAGSTKGRKGPHYKHDYETPPLVAVTADGRNTIDIPLSPTTKVGKWMEG